MNACLLASAQLPLHTYAVHNPLPREMIFPIQLTQLRQSPTDMPTGKSDLETLFQSNSRVYPIYN